MPVNDGKEWTDADDRLLRNLASRNTDTDEIARQLGRSVNAVYSRASELGISLKPKDR